MMNCADIKDICDGCQLNFSRDIGSEHKKVVTLRAVGTPGIPEEGHDVTTIEFWNLGSVMLVL